MTTRDALRRHGGVASYRAHPAATATPLTLAGFYAVHSPLGSTTHVYYCEPATGRCSCGADAGSCPHIATVRALVTGATRHTVTEEDAA